MIASAMAVAKFGHVKAIFTCKICFLFELSKNRPINFVSRIFLSRRKRYNLLKSSNQMLNSKENIRTIVMKSNSMVFMVFHILFTPRLNSNPYLIMKSILNYMPETYRSNSDSLMMWNCKSQNFSFLIPVSRE